MEKRFLILFLMFSLAVHAPVILLSLRIDEPAAPKEGKALKADLLVFPEMKKHHYAIAAQSS